MALTLRRFKDGKTRAKIQVMHRITATDAVRILALSSASWEGKPTTRHQVEEILRDGLWNHGIEHWYFAHEGTTTTDYEAQWDWAVEQVRHYWPTWATEIEE